MATLYKENTEYVNPLAGGLPKSSIPSAPKTSTAAITPKATTNVNPLAGGIPKASIPAPKAITTPGATTSVTPKPFGPPTGLSEEEKAFLHKPGDYTVGTSIKKPSSPDTENLISSLSDFLAANKSEMPGEYIFGEPNITAPVGNIQALWATPSDQTQVITTPEGAQYAIDPTQPDKIIKTIRPELNFSQNELIRKGLNPALYEIDHIAPLWAGAMDSMTNREILRKSDHAEKTKVQSVPYTLLANQLISPKEAMEMAMDWKNKATYNIGEPDQYGLINLEVAKKQAAAWKAGKDIKIEGQPEDPTSYLGKLMKSIGDTSNDFYKKVILGGAAEPTEMIAAREFSKGAVSAIPFADVLFPGLDETGVYEDKSVQTTANISRFAGRIAGDVAIFKGVGKLFSVARALTAKLLGDATMLAKDATTMQKDVIMTRDLLKATGTLGEVSARSYNANKITNALKSGGLMAVIGQTHRQPEDLDGELQGRIKTMAYDTMYGTMLGLQGHSFGGYARVGALTFGLGSIQGQPTQDATINAITMMALHGLGHGSEDVNVAAAKRYFDYQKAAGKYIESAPLVSESAVPVTTKDGITKKIAKGIVRNLYEPGAGYKVDKMAQTTYLYEASRRMQYLSVEFRNKYAGKDFSVLDSNGKFASTEKVELERQNKIINDKIDRLVADEKMTPEQGKKEKLDAMLSANEIHKSGLSPAEREAVDIEDMRTLGQYFKKYGGLDPIKEGSVDNVKIKLLITEPEVQELLKRIKPEDIAITVSNKNTVGISGTKLRSDGINKVVEASDTARSSFIESTENGRSVYTGYGRLTLDPSAASEPDFKIGNAKLKASGEKTWDPNKILKTEVDIINEDGTTSVIKIGNVASERAVSNINNLNNFNENSANYINPSNNNESIAERMAENNLKSIQVVVKIIPETGRMDLKTGKPTMYAKAYIDDRFYAPNIVDSILKKPMPKAAEPSFETVQEDISKALKLVNDKAAEKVVETIAEGTPTKIPKEMIVDESGEVIGDKPVDEFEAFAAKPKEYKQAIMNTRPIKAEVKPVIKTEIGPVGAKTVSVVAKKLPEDLKPRDFLDSPDGINRGFSKIIESEKELLPQDSLQRIKLEDFEESSLDFLHDAVSKSAKESPESMNKAADIFISKISDKFKELGLPDPTKMEGSNIFRQIFRNSIYKDHVQTFVIDTNRNFTKSKSINRYAPSIMQKEITKATGIKDFVYLEEGLIKEEASEYEDEVYELPVGIKKAPKITAKIVREKFLNHGYVTFFKLNDPLSAMGIKFDSKLAGGKKIEDEGAMDEFKNSILSAIGYEKGVDNLNSFVKRLKSIDSREKPSPIEGEIHRIIVIKDKSGINKTTKEATPNFNKIKINPVVPNGDKVKEDVGNLLLWDGDSFQDLSLLARKGELSGSIETPYWIKDTVTHKGEDGKIIHFKWESRAWPSEDIKASIESKLGIKFGPNDIVVSEGSAKEGLKSKTAIDKGDYWEFNLPSEAWAMKDHNPHRAGATFSLSGIGSKLPLTFTDAEMEAITSPYKDHAKSLLDIRGGFDNFTADPVNNINVLVDLWKKYPELGKTKYADSLFGDLRTSAKLGAGKYELGKNLNLVIEKLITRQFLGGQFFKGDTMHLMTDFGSLRKPWTGTREFIPHKEVVVSKSFAIKTFGSESYNNRFKKGEEIYMLMWRQPVLNSPSVMKVRVHIAEDHNLDIGDSQIIVNAADKKGTLNADADGDTVQAMAIGGRNGVSEKIADFFESVYNEGQMYFPQLTKAKKVPWDGVNTSKKLEVLEDNNMNGGRSIGIFAASSRVMREIVANDFKVVVGPPVGGVRILTTYYNDNITNIESIPTVDKNGKNAFENSPNSEFVIEPVYGKEEEFKLGFGGQAAVDANGTTDLSSMLGSNKPEEFVTKMLFTNSGDKAIQSFLYKEMEIFNTPYRIEKMVSAENLLLGKKNIVSFTKFLDPYIKMQKDIKSSGGRVSFAGEISMKMEGYKPLDTLKDNPEAQKEFDSFTIRSVRDLFKDEFEAMKSEAESGINSNLNRWRAIYKDIKDIRTSEGKRDTVKIRNTAKQEWKKFKRQYNPTPSDRRKISLWAAASNTEGMLNWASARFIMRPNFLIDETPEIAKAYYESQNKWRPKKVDDIVPPESIEPPTPPTPKEPLPDIESKAIPETIKSENLVKGVTPKEVFVFGSNLAGRHGKGAALDAVNDYGAIYGQGEGLQGKSYGLPTKDANLKTLPLADIKKNADKFLDFANKNPDTKFNLTAVGTGLAGYKPEDIAPMFRDAPKNVIIPEKFKSFSTPETIKSGNLVKNVGNEKTGLPITHILQSADKKALAKASYANKFIGFGDGLPGSSTQHYREQAGKLANTGDYSPSDRIFVSVPGRRGAPEIYQSQIDKTIKEAVDAVEKGAVLLTDNKTYVNNSSYNIGEKQLKDKLESINAKYSELVINGEKIGTWKKDLLPETIKSGNLVKSVKAKTASAALANPPKTK